ncbi:DUF2298 domain-containing protein [Chitinibacteraceae bacterium HSL-7]
MGLILTVLIILLVVLHMAALGQLLQRPGVDRHLARALALLVLIPSCFALEHFIGLGRLSWAWPLTTAAAVLLLRGRLASACFWRAELPFLVPFAWALAWRFLWPDLDQTAEHLTNLYFIRNYIDGATLPPPDQWLPGETFSVYYALLHYAAALQARIFGLSAGWAMNVGFAVVIGLMGSLAWSMVARWSESRLARVLVVAAVIVGGNGLAPMLPSLFGGSFDAGTATTRLWANTRFTGTFDQNITAEWGRKLFHSGPAELLQQPFGPRDLPLENTGYYIYLGDLHPPLAGFVLLFLALAIMAHVQAARPPQDASEANDAAVTDGILQAALVMTVPITIISNSWVFPLQLALVLGWLGWRLATRQALNPRALILGALLGGALIYPFMAHFAPSSLAAPIRLVPALDHTPLAQWLAIWWPVLWLVTLTYIRRVGDDSASARFGAFIASAIVLALLLSELFYVDDNLGDRYNRFNSVLKWWSWIFPAALLTLSSLLIAAPRRVWRWLSLVPLLACLSYLWPQFQYLATQPKLSAGRLAGDGWLMRDSAHRRIVEYLRAAPPGVVIEGVDGGAYMTTSAFALHSNQPAMNGWFSHVAQWRGDPAWVYAEANAVRQLYRGELADPQPWLTARNVEYVVWSRFDETRNPGRWAALNTELSPSYIWHPLAPDGAQQFGVWVRR